jgi:hypothetical protein
MSLGATLGSMSIGMKMTITIGATVGGGVINKVLGGSFATGAIADGLTAYIVCFDQKDFPEVIGKGVVAGLANAFVQFLADIALSNSQNPYLDSFTIIHYVRAFIDGYGWGILGAYFAVIRLRMHLIKVQVLLQAVHYEIN